MVKRLTKFALVAALGLALALTFSCSGDDGDEGGAPSSGNTFKDNRDGKSYKYVKIGDQTWMAENLNYAVASSRCYGEGDTCKCPDDNYPCYGSHGGICWGYTPAEIQGFCDKYGRLYYWETAKTACPSGWRLPSNADWDQLKSFVNELRGDEFGLFDLRDTSWGNSEDKYGFSALPGGYGYSPGSEFYFEAEGSSCVLWSRSASDEGDSFLVYGSVSFVGNERLISVRCIKDN